MKYMILFETPIVELFAFFSEHDVKVALQFIFTYIVITNVLKKYIQYVYYTFIRLIYWLLNNLSIIYS